MNALERLDASLSLPEDERMLLASVQNLARTQLAPRAEGYDRSAEFPWDNVKAINALGLNAMFIPEAYGGAPMSYCAYLACVREISKACAATGIIWATNFHGIKPVITYGSEEQKARLLPRVAEGGLVSLVITETGAGSDATGMKTSFEAQGDEIVVSGSKIFITNGDVADLLLVFGKWSGIADAKGAISALVVEKGTPGLSVLRTEDKLGHPRLEHRRAVLRRLPRAAREPARRARRRAQDPARLAQQIAPQRRRPRARHRARRVRGRGRLHQRAAPVGAAHHRIPGHTVHARRPRLRTGACASAGCGMWAPWSMRERTTSA